MTARWVALGLSALLATAANGQPVAKDEPAEKPATEKPAIEKPAAEGRAPLRSRSSLLRRKRRKRLTRRPRKKPRPARRRAVSATWRLQGDKAELHLWEEAKECPKGELPKYEAKVDKKPPPLVGR